MTETTPDLTPPAASPGGPTAPAPAEPGRRTYACPTLVRYGAVSDLTRTAGTVGRRDGRRSRRRTGY